ncbi:hypothetical protein [Anaerorhabdus furcosa]|uniref:Uncharacterized protein n=1 Tax=Anaerorhabdus furcosa TaxID=118967 RepID=A0A1T4LRL2_9FIRM|nr:hypothetical protein [Anaerorhabdus furcosa]SJZ57399.1 hypothetical protein SAMN02745191_1012 [Anaerorhabdus furcosa]
MLGKILTKAKGFFPPGYKYVTGKMNIEVCNSNANIVPLTGRVYQLKLDEYRGFTVKAGNLILADVGFTQSGWVNNTSTILYLDFLSAFNFNWNDLISKSKPIDVIHKYNPTNKSVFIVEITSWFEKSGGGGGV